MNKVLGSRNTLLVPTTLERWREWSHAAPRGPIMSPLKALEYPATVAPRTGRGPSLAVHYAERYGCINAFPIAVTKDYLLRVTEANEAPIASHIWIASSTFRQL